nr:meprin-B peptide B1 [mice, kidney, Peptide Partial, 19 aa] [Mus sp.]
FNQVSITNDDTGYILQTDI